MIENEDIERLKDIFVTRRECDETTGELEDKICSTGHRYAVLESQMKTAIWLAKTTLGAVVASIVGAVMLLILR